LILLLALNSALHRLLFVSDAALKLKNTLLSVTLFLLDVFHEVIEDVLRLQLGFLGLACLLLLAVENLRFAPKTGLEVVCLNLARDEVLFHALKHVQVCATR